MGLKCWVCAKSVSTEVPDETVMRATLECPECFDETLVKIREEIREELLGSVEDAVDKSWELNR